MLSCVSWHTYTTEGAALVQTGALVVARVTLTLVNVDLASGTSETLRAVTSE